MAERTYTAVDNADTDSSFSDSEPKDHAKLRVSPFLKTSEDNTRKMIATLIVTHLLTIIAAVWSGAYLWKNFFNLDQACTRWTTHSPWLAKHVDIKYKDVQFDGRFVKSNLYRHNPSPKVDAAWSALGGDYRAMRIPDDEIELAGLKKDYHVRIHPKYGGGYPANVESLHYLHCLNVIRQGLKWNYEYYRKLGTHAFAHSEKLTKKHMTHCIDILRQHVMCTANTDVFGQVWWKTPNGDIQAFVDFNTVHKCRNFEDIRAFVEPRQLPKNTDDDFVESPTGEIHNGIP